MSQKFPFFRSYFFFFSCSIFSFLIVIMFVLFFIMFVLFRVFDITKPYPVSYYDKNFKNSFGVVMDDVCAGLYVVAVMVLYIVFSS